MSKQVAHMSITTEMSQQLKDALIAKGWKPEEIGSWGRLVSGGSTIEVEHNGKIWRHWNVATVQAGDQIAIVRFN